MPNAFRYSLQNTIHLTTKQKNDDAQTIQTFSMVISYWM